MRCALRIVLLLFFFELYFCLLGVKKLSTNSSTNIKSQKVNFHKRITTKLADEFWQLGKDNDTAYSIPQIYGLRTGTYSNSSLEKMIEMSYKLNKKT